MAQAPTLTLLASPVPDGALPGVEVGAPAVVLVHGLASSCDADFVQTGIAEALLSRGRDVILVDLPGHGSAAGGGDGEITVAGLLADIAGGAAQLAGGPVDVIGYSLGGRLAWDLQAAGLPVRRLVVGGVAPQEPFGAIDPAALAGVVLRGEQPGDPLTGMIGGMLAQAPGDRATLVELVAALGTSPFSAAPADAPTVPTLLMAGDADPVAGDPAWAAEVLPDGSVLTVPGDHLAALRSPEFLAAALAHLG